MMKQGVSKFQNLLETKLSTVLFYSNYKLILLVFLTRILFTSLLTFQFPSLSLAGRTCNRRHCLYSIYHYPQKIGRPQTSRCGLPVIAPKHWGNCHSYLHIHTMDSLNPYIVSCSPFEPFIIIIGHLISYSVSYPNQMIISFTYNIHFFLHFSLIVLPTTIGAITQDHHFVL